MGKRGYRCENEYGLDPCEAAKSGRIFAEDEVPPAMGDRPKCPAKTASGAVCGQPLVGPIPMGQDVPWRRLAVIGGGVLGVAALGAGAFWLIPSGSPRLVVGANPVVLSQAGPSGATGTLTLRNAGDGDLVIAGIDLSPPTFTIAKPTERIPPGESGDLTILYAPGVTNPSEGMLSLRSNDADSPKTVRLLVSGDPWWVYDRLDSTSTIRSKP